MKQKLNKELEKMDSDILISNMDEVCAYAMVAIMDIEQLRKVVVKDIRASKFELKLETIKDTIGNLFGYYVDLNFRMEDIRLYQEKLITCHEFIEYQDRLISIVDDNNYDNVYKLSRLTSSYFIKNFNYLDDRQDGLDYLYKGLHYNSSRDDICFNREEYLDFFNEKYNELSSSKIYKKMI